MPGTGILPEGLNSFFTNQLRFIQFSSVQIKSSLIVRNLSLTSRGGLMPKFLGDGMGNVRIFKSEWWPQLEGAQPWMSCAAGRSVASGDACSARVEIVEFFLSETPSYQDLH